MRINTRFFFFLLTIVFAIHADKSSVNGLPVTRPAAQVQTSRPAPLPSMAAREEREDPTLALRDFMENVQSLGGSPYLRSIVKRNAANAAGPRAKISGTQDKLQSSSPGFLFLPIVSDTSTSTSGKGSSDSISENKGGVPIRQTMFINIEAPDGGQLVKIDDKGNVKKLDEPCTDSRKKADDAAAAGGPLDQIGGAPGGFDLSQSQPGGLTPTDDKPSAEPGATFDSPQGAKMIGTPSTPSDPIVTDGSSDGNMQETGVGAEGGKVGGSLPPSFDSNAPNGAVDPYGMRDPLLSAGAGKMEGASSLDPNAPGGAVNLGGLQGSNFGADRGVFDPPQGTDHTDKSKNHPVTPPVDQATSSNSTPPTDSDPRAALNGSAKPTLTDPPGVDSSKDTKIVFKPLNNSDSSSANPGNSKSDPPFPPSSSDWKDLKANSALGEGDGDISTGAATNGEAGGHDGRMRKDHDIDPAQEMGGKSAFDPTVASNSTSSPPDPPSYFSSPLTSSNPTSTSKPPTETVASPLNAAITKGGANDYFIYPVEQKGKVVDLKPGDMVAYVDNAGKVAGGPKSQGLSQILDDPLQPQPQSQSQQQMQMQQQANDLLRQQVQQMQPIPSLIPTPSSETSGPPPPPPPSHSIRRSHPRMWTLIRRAVTPTDSSDSTTVRLKAAKQGKKGLKLMAGQPRSTIKYYSGKTNMRREEIAS